MSETTANGTAPLVEVRGGKLATQIPKKAYELAVQP